VLITQIGSQTAETYKKSTSIYTITQYGTKCVCTIYTTSWRRLIANYNQHTKKYKFSMHYCTLITSNTGTVCDDKTCLIQNCNMKCHDQYKIDSKISVQKGIIQQSCSKPKIKVKTCHRHQNLWKEQKYHPSSQFSTGGHCSMSCLNLACQI